MSLKSIVRLITDLVLELNVVVKRYLKNCSKIVKKESMFLDTNLYEFQLAKIILFLTLFFSVIFRCFDVHFDAVFRPYYYDLNHTIA